MLLYFKDHENIPRPAGTILLSAWLDMSHSMTENSQYASSDFVYIDSTHKFNHIIAKTFAGKDYSPSSPEISMALSKNLKGIPSHLCCYGSAEVFETDSKMWIQQCKADNVDVLEYCGKGGIHTFSLGGLVADKQLEKESDHVIVNYMVNQTKK